MEDNTLKDETLVPNDEPEILESFVCCVCLDLLYKPIVLSCGHVSCFWCVHKSMDGLHESHCPICRHAYYHFPTICQMFHVLLLKIYPDAYRRREKQTLEEEAKMGFFSPQFDADNGILPSCTTVNPASDSCSVEPFECTEQSGSATHKSHNRDEGTMYFEYTSDITSEVNGKRLPQNEHSQQLKIVVADLICTICKKLLFHPVVLNCGHVCCETCIVDLSDDMLRCQVCQSPHPRGFPKVCLVLEQFIEEQFPEEYAQRRAAIQLGQIKLKPETSSCSLDNDKGEKKAWEPDHGLIVHIGVGCDFCGIYPITGDRYRCADCKESIGFDLCSYCYKSRSKRPGRFNQQHTPEHKFQLVQWLGRVREQLNGQESSENTVVIADPFTDGDGEENQSDDLASDHDGEINQSDDLASDDVGEENQSDDPASDDDGEENQSDDPASDDDGEENQGDPEAAN